MKKKSAKLLFGSIFLFFAICNNSDAADFDYIDINAPFLHKIPIVAPYFKPLSENNNQEIISAKRASKLLADSLEFTGYFKIVEYEKFIDNPNNVNFQNWWLNTGAELMITGEIEEKENYVKINMRLFDIFSERMLVGKSYKGKNKDIRKIILKFCSEVLFRITGDKGIFNSKIAFVSTSSGSKDIYTSDFDGYALERITHSESITLSPSWSSDGKYIAYTSFKKGKPDIFIMNIDTKTEKSINKKGTNITPAWLPGRFELTASLSFSGDPEIYLLTGDGKMIKRLTYSKGIDVSPSWSPDGRKFAFVSKRGGTPHIYIGNYLSGKVERLTYEGYYNQEPSWSPNGDKIAFSSREAGGGESNIFTIGANGEGLLRLTEGSGGDNETPSWSPDSNLIVFSSTREGASRIYVMNRYGRDQRRLLTMKGEQFSPQWSPEIEP